MSSKFRSHRENQSSKVEELCPNLGTFDDVKSSYKISANCLQVLHDIETELLSDCYSNRRTRLNLGKMRAIEKHFIQILIASGSVAGHNGKSAENSNLDSEQRNPIVQVVVRILVNLTLPLECLSDPRLSSRTDFFARPSLEFNKLQTYLLESKKAFLKYSFGTAIVVKLLRTFSSPTTASANFSSPGFIDGLRTNGEPGQSGETGDMSGIQRDTSGFSKTDLIMTNNCLVLLRNLLHVPDAAEFYQFEPFRTKTLQSPKGEFNSTCSQLKSGLVFSKRQCDKNTCASHSSSLDKGNKSISSGSSQESDSEGNSSRTSIHTCVDKKKGKACDEKMGHYSVPNKDFSSGWSRCDPREEWQDVYKKLMWNLLAQGLDGTLLFLLSSKEYRSLTPSIVQLVTLLFKDQQAEQLQKILYADRVSQSSDEDLESDESSSVQVSSSSSFFSDTSLPSSSGSGEGETSYEKETTNMGKKGYHLKLGNDDQNYMNPSDSGISSSSNTSSAQSVVSHESVTLERLSGNGMKKTVTYAAADSYYSTNSSSTGDDEQVFRVQTSDQHSSEDQIQSQGDQEDVPEASDPENSCCSEAVKQSQVIQVAQKVERRAEQTSGISNGSSEEEQSRVTRKVMKPHHRSQSGTCKTNESDSSEEYNTKPSNGDAMVVSHDKGRGAAAFLPIKTKTKCSPSVCFDAALITAVHSSSKSNGHQDLMNQESLLAPWNKKKVFSSKNFPLGVDSYVPTDEDIASLLKDFVVKFLHNCFGELVADLMDQLLSFPATSFDPAHLFWLISYFTKLAVAMELDYHHLEPIMKTEIFGFLVFEGVMMTEQLELHIMDGRGKQLTSQSAILRKVHLIISSLHELFNVILTYSSKLKPGPEMDSLHNIRSDLSEMTDLPQLFLLCIRSFIPTVHSKQFLIEAIIAHHTSMILLEPLYLEGRFDLPIHLKQFATAKIMDTYGKILQDFETNTDFVNDCIMTMMHHVSGDLMSPDCLFQPIILKTFSLIMESEVDVKDCWGDMIEYIMIRFVRAAKKSPDACIRKMFGHSSSGSCSSKSNSSKTLTHSGTDEIDELLTSRLETGLTLSPTKADRDRLYWLYLQYEQAPDPLSMIVDSLVEDYDIPVEKKDVLNQLLSKGIINDDEFSSLEGKSNLNKWNIPQVRVVDTEACDKIQELVDDLSRREMKLQILWIKDCISKFGAVKLAFPGSDSIVPFKCHALALHSHILRQPMVIVPFNEKQEMALNDHSFIQLLHELGIDQSQPSGHFLYPRIPSILTPSTLNAMASKLGAIDQSIFCTNKMSEKSDQSF